jgi:hypothetical protein
MSDEIPSDMGHPVCGGLKERAGKVRFDDPNERPRAKAPKFRLGYSWG